MYQNKAINKEVQQSDRVKEVDNDLVLSYLTLRNFIGALGLILPWLLCLFPKRPSAYYFGIEPSISDYFYTNRGDFLVVTLCVLGVFLLTYKGYTKRERLLTVIAAVCGMGVAFFPTHSKCDECGTSIHTMGGGVFGNFGGEGLHLAFAAIFLLSLAVISLRYFTRGNSETKVNGKLTQKGKRNIVYRVCCWIMIGCVGVLGVYFPVKQFFL